MYCQLFSFIITLSNIMQVYPTPIPFWTCTVKIHIPNATVRQKMHGLWLHELKPFKTDRLYSSCTIFKALALVYTRACLSLLPSILGNSFLFTFNPVNLHRSCGFFFSHSTDDYHARMLRSEARDFSISRAFGLNIAGSMLKTPTRVADFWR